MDKAVVTAKTGHSSPEKFKSLGLTESTQDVDKTKGPDGEKTRATTEKTRGSVSRGREGSQKKGIPVKGVPVEKVEGGSSKGIEAAKSRRVSKIVMDQERFDKRYGYRRVNISLGRRVVWHFNKVRKWKRSNWCEFVKDRLPIIRWVRSYQLIHLREDILGGVMVTLMAVPQALAYGYLVGVPPIHGLYSSIYIPLLYVIFGAFAIVSMMVGTVVSQITEGVNGHVEEHVCCSKTPIFVPPAEAISVATAVTLAVGVWQLVFGALNAGLLAVWLSDHLVQGLTSGAAIHVLTSQVKTMTGIEKLPSTSEPFGLIKFYMCFFAQVRSAKVDVVVLSLVCILLLLMSSYVIDRIIKKWTTLKFPMELIVVGGTTIITWLSANTRWKLNVPIVGEVGSGLMAPRVPNISVIGKVYDLAMPISIISFVVHIAMAKLISKKLDYQIDSNQEWLALGMMHTVSSFFGCFAGGTSLGRSMMQVKFGTHSQLSTATSCLFIIVVVYGAGSLIHFLPKAALSAIVVVSLKDLILQIARARHLYKQSIADYLIFSITFISVVLVSVNVGLVIGILIALLTVVFRTQWAESICLGRIPGTADFKGLGQYRMVEEIKGVRVFRFDAPLYFANAELFMKRVYDAMGINPLEIQLQMAAKKKENGTKTVDEAEEAPLLRDNATNEEVSQLTHLIIDCSSIAYVDLMGKDALAQLSVEFKKCDITVFYAHCKVAVRQFLENTDFHKRVPKTHLFVKIGDAVEQAQFEQQLSMKHSDLNLAADVSRILPIEKTMIEYPEKTEDTQRESPFESVILTDVTQPSL